MEYLLILAYIQAGLAVTLITLGLNYNREPNIWRLVAASIVIGTLWPISTLALAVLLYKRMR